MSMVELTEGKPASPDGLVMEWIDAPFGPFFPGLPAGLNLCLTLDGDSIASATVKGIPAENAPVGIGLAALSDWLAAALPLSPVAMRELACRAAEAATGRIAPIDALTARAAAVERERIASHINWLAGLTRQVGLASLARRAAALQRDIRTAQADRLGERAEEIKRLLRRIQHGSLMGMKLSGVGLMTGAAEGPVARAGGLATDARNGDAAYAELGFEPVTQSGGDAMARLRQRCAEVEQCLDLIAKAGSIRLPEMPAAADDGHGMATLETPRGPATLHLTLKGGAVASAHVTTPFAALATHVPALVAQLEFADALTAINSLDLDPWSTTT